MKELLTLINNNITDYQAQERGFNDVDTLIYNRRMLATRLYELADKLGDLKESQNMTYFRRKSGESVSKKSYEDKGETATKAKTLAEVDNIALLSLEKQADSFYYRCKYIYDAGVNVLESMTQDVAYLRTEKAKGSD